MSGYKQEQNATATPNSRHLFENNIHRKISIDSDGIVPEHGQNMDNTKRFRKRRRFFVRPCREKPVPVRRAKSEDVNSFQPDEISNGSKKRFHSHGRCPAVPVTFIAAPFYDDSSTEIETSSIQRSKLTLVEECPKDLTWHLHANNCAKDPVITINVSGMHFQTYESTLRRFPNSMLGDPLKRRAFWNEQLKEIFLDRSRACFEAILHIYRSGGQVVRPVMVPVELFIEELIFYELKDDVWANFCESEGCRIRTAEKKPENAFQRRVWELMEHPDSSPFARFLASLSVSVIIISTVSFCLESLPELKPTDSSREWSSPFFWIEFTCCLWFSIELIVRFLASPSKTDFMKSFLNVLDFVAVAPFFINLMFQDDNKNSSSTSFAVLRIVRLVRVFRIFKLSRHFTGLQVLGKTFRASVQEFFLLIFFMGIALVLFSSGVYFAEQGEQGTKFTSIPASFWYVLATMTTVGYGDLVPHGVYGKIVGSCCALIGVLTLALPVPIIVANFKRFYRQEIILAKMYEQNHPPKQVQAMIQQAKTFEGSLAATDIRLPRAEADPGNIV